MRALDTLKDKTQAAPESDEWIPDGSHEEREEAYEHEAEEFDPAPELNYKDKQAPSADL
jgi:hypothetical protein